MGGLHYPPSRVDRCKGSARDGGTEGMSSTVRRCDSMVGVRSEGVVGVRGESVVGVRSEGVLGVRSEGVIGAGGGERVDPARCCNWRCACLQGQDQHSHRLATLSAGLAGRALCPGSSGVGGRGTPAAAYAAACTAAWPVLAGPTPPAWLQTGTEGVQK